MAEKDRGLRPLPWCICCLLGFWFSTFSLVGPPVMDEVKKLMHQTPEMEARLSPGNLVHQFGARHGWNPEYSGSITILINHRMN